MKNHAHSFESDLWVVSAVGLLLLAGTGGCGSTSGPGAAPLDAAADGPGDRMNVGPVLEVGPDSADATSGPDLVADAAGPEADGTNVDTALPVDSSVPDVAGPATDGARDATDGGPDVAVDVAVDGSSDGAIRDTAAEVGDASGDGAVSACGACTAYGPAAESGRVASTTLATLSGISASRNNPGVLYVHNDMQRAEFFAVSEAGTLLSTFTLTGATVQDLEDMAVAPCPSGSCVYLADIGGNLAARTNYTILRTPEPSVQVNQAPATMAVSSERLVFTYPDGAHNAESLLVDPSLAAIYIITKVNAGLPSAVYRLPAVFGAASVAAQKVADLTVPGPSDQPATSANAHPCVPAFLLTTNTTLWEFRAPAGGRFEDAFAAAPVVVPVATENQREGVTYRPDGRGYFTTGEGSRPAINRVACR